MKNHIRAIGSAFDHLKEIVGENVGVRGQCIRPTVTRTGVTSLDLVLGGGLPPGLVEIFGEESSGKTTLVGSILESAQADGLTTAYLPTEHHEVDFLHNLNVDPQRLLLAQAQDPHAGLAAIADLVRAPDTVAVIDSLTALQGKMSSEEWAEVRWWALSEIGEVISNNSCLVIVSQVRTRRSSTPGRRYVNDTESASYRLSDLFSVRLELKRAEVTDDYYELMINVVANLYEQPARILRVPTMKASGIIHEVDDLRTAVMLGLLQQVGAWYNPVSDEDPMRFGPGVNKAAAQFQSSSSFDELVQIVYGGT